MFFPPVPVTGLIDGWSLSMDFDRGRLGPGAWDRGRLHPAPGTVVSYNLRTPVTKPAAGWLAGWPGINYFHFCWLLGWCACFLGVTLGGVPFMHGPTVLTIMMHAALVPPTP